MNSESKIYSYLLSLLAGKDYSRKKLQDKLFKKGYSEDEIEEVLNWAIQKKYWSEDRYLEQRIKMLGQRGYGIPVIALKLREENLRPNEEYIADILGEWGISPLSQVLELIQKYLSQKRIPIEEFGLSEKDRVRILRNIISKGHPFDLVSDQLDTYLRSSIF